jgi:hypothetical protein
MNACRLLDQVGRVGSKIIASWTDLELLYRQPWCHPATSSFPVDRIWKERGSLDLGWVIGIRTKITLRFI